MYVNKAYDLRDDQLRREFQDFGTVLSTKIVTDLRGKSRGYGFVEFKHKEDFLCAFRNASSKLLGGRQVFVDAVYAKINKSFRPLRLGGGLGSKRKTKDYRTLCILKQFQDKRKAKRPKKAGILPNSD